VTQDVFIKAYQNLSKLRRWDSFAVWTYTIASNLCSKWKRSKSRRPDREFIEDQDEDALENPSLDAYRMDIISNSLHDALDSLPEIYQEALTLHYLGGMSTDDIAKSLGASPTTIRQRLVRARAQLKEEMLVMMSRTFEQQRLKAIFTFRIVEMVKHIRIQPIPLAKGLPWGLSLATGIIVAFLSFGTHLNSLSTIGAFMGSPLPGETKVLKTGEIPVDVLKASNISVISSQRWNGSGLGSVVPSLQNALFMSPQAGDTWTKKADMPTARWGLSTCVVNGKIYAIGGEAQDIFSTVEEYDPKNDTWTKKADMPTARYYFTTCAANGKIYAIGGTVEENAMDISTVEEYDPVADKWTRKTDLPRRLHTLSTSVVNDKIYGIGGVDSGVIIPTVYEYDPLVDKWTAKADMPTKRWRVCTSTVNGRIYAIGGLDDLFIVNPNAKALPTVEEYDPDTDKWTKKTDMPMPRADHACSAVGGKIYAFGGWRTDINENIASSVLEYDTGFSGERVDSKGKLPTTWGDVRIASKR
jgi:RNA polymerase sigma factor (sigma-70 family)